MRWLGVSLLCGPLLISCGGSTPKYTAAAVTAGLAVAAAAANRAVTDECWGQCSHGLICDRKAGVCVEPPETTVTPIPPQTDEDRGCIEEEDGRWLCPDDPEAYAPPLGSAAQPTPSSQRPPAPQGEAGAGP